MSNAAYAPLPCPFCGTVCCRPVPYDIAPDKRGSFVVCMKCNAIGPLKFSKQSETAQKKAVAAWNELRDRLNKSTTSDMSPKSVSGTSAADSLMAVFGLHRSNWIDCRKQMPPKKKYVLFCDKHGTIEIAQLTRVVGEKSRVCITRHNVYWRYTEDNTWWMPLPEPPSEEER